MLKCLEERYIEELRKKDETEAVRFVHGTGHTVYKTKLSHPMRYHPSGYKTQTLSLIDPNAHWENTVTPP